jgi:hypothetical protein
MTKVTNNTKLFDASIYFAGIVITVLLWWVSGYWSEPIMFLFRIIDAVWFFGALFNFIETLRTKYVTTDDYRKGEADRIVSYDTKVNLRIVK